MSSWLRACINAAVQCALGNAFLREGLHLFHYRLLKKGEAGTSTICSTARCKIRSWLEILDTTTSCSTDLWNGDSQHLFQNPLMKVKFTDLLHYPLGKAFLRSHFTNQLALPAPQAGQRSDPLCNKEGSAPPVRLEMRSLGLFNIRRMRRCSRFLCIRSKQATKHLPRATPCTLEPITTRRRCPHIRSNGHNKNHRQPHMHITTHGALHSD